MRWTAKIALGLALVVACRAPREPHVLPPPKVAKFPALEERDLALRIGTNGRPTIDLAVITPLTDPRLPWPLERAPTLHPHYEVARDPVRCTAAWQAKYAALRPEVVTYAKAWCRIEGGEFGAIDDLGAVARQTATGDVASSARTDVIELLASQRDAATAIAILHRLQLYGPDELDRLAASFAALGHRPDAIATSERAAGVDRFPESTAACERLLAYGTVDDFTLGHFEEIPEVASGPCIERANVAACAIDRASRTTVQTGATLVAIRDCYNAYPDDPVDARAWMLVVAFRWPVHTPHDWLELARDAENAMAIDVGEHLAVTALENALHTDCNAETIRTIVAGARRIAASPHHHADLDARVGALRNATITNCALR